MKNYGYRVQRMAVRREEKTRTSVLLLCTLLVLIATIGIVWIKLHRELPVLGDEEDNIPLRFQEIPKATLVPGVDYPVDSTNQVEVKFSMELDLNKLVKAPTNQVSETNLVR